MINKQELVAKYKNDLKKAQEELDAKIFSLGEADSGKESRFPTGRTELEDTIQLLKNKVQRVKDVLSEVEESLNVSSKGKVLAGCIVKIEMNGVDLEYLVTKEFGDLANNVISLQSPVGKAIEGKSIGENVKTEDGVEIVIKEII